MTGDPPREASPASYRTIWEIAGPILLSLLAQNIVGVTDTAFLGRVGEVELGASAIGGVFYLILYMIVFGFATGVQILVARRHGEKKYASIGQIIDNSFYFIAGVSLLITAAIFFGGPPFFRMVLSSGAITEASSIFLKYRVLGLFFAATTLLFRSFYTGISFTKYLSISATIMASVNVVLDYLLIFGHAGLPALGIRGAAIATSISEAVGLLFFILITRKNPLLKRYKLFRLIRPDFSVISKTLGISVFVMLQYLLSIGSWFVFFMIVEKMGERPLAVSNIIRSLYLFMMLPGWAFGSVASTLVSGSLGEEKPENVIPVIRRIAGFSFLMMLSILIIALPFYLHLHQ
ncbi:MAG: MATE family efflux transporter [Marinilabiliales bacterium]|nr:MATE family efflux transporter [Marinilabiliales bacterium]